MQNIAIEKEDRTEKIIRLIVKVFKAIMWAFFLTVWGRCLFVGGIIGMAAAAVGIIVIIISSI
ncbi:MAG: hypothetical protein MJ131_02550 [Lachnospiraceae bacterium]|nr:hypothetical protein [Lachnospiraceae bacterium]